MPDDAALVFLNNHDNQRGHGGGGSNLITFKDSYSRQYIVFLQALFDQNVSMPYNLFSIPVYFCGRFVFYIGSF